MLDYHIVTLVSNKEEFPRKFGQEDWEVKEAWERWGPLE
jgi:hypothetical protein